jgi:NACalpha-BTF3-like transcription factor
VKKRKQGSSDSAGGKKPAPAPRSALWDAPKEAGEEDKDAEEEEEEEEEAEEEEAQEEEDTIELDDDAVEFLDDDPVELLMQQGISREQSQKALATAKGDVDVAVMVIIREKELAAEEKLMAAVGLHTVESS